MDRQAVVASACEHHGLIGYAAVLLIERWLGRTDKTKSASILDLAFNAVAGIIKVLWNRYRRAPVVAPPTDKGTPQ